MPWCSGFVFDEGNVKESLPKIDINIEEVLYSFNAVLAYTFQRENGHLMATSSIEEQATFAAVESIVVRNILYV